MTLQLVAHIRQSCRYRTGDQLLVVSRAQIADVAGLRSNFDG